MEKIKYSFTDVVNMRFATQNVGLEPWRFMHYLDITSDVCPMTFVRVKLLIEKMNCGARANVRLVGEDPLRNVPWTLIEHGHKIISLDPCDAKEPDGPHILIFEKKIRKKDIDRFFSPVSAEPPE